MRDWEHFRESAEEFWSFVGYFIFTVLWIVTAPLWWPVWKLVKWLYE